MLWDSEAMSHVIVVGGGVAGLTAALDLVRAGADVTVLEATDRVGGKLRRAEVAGVGVDVGAESMLALRPEGTGLVEQLGLADRLTTPATTSAAIWTRGALHPLPSPTLLGIPADADAARGILTIAEVARLRAESPAAPLAEDEPVGAYVARRLGDAVVDRLLDPLIGGVYAGDARRLSLQAAAGPLYAVAAAGGSLLAAAAALGTGGTRGKGAFAGVVGGFGSLPSALAEGVTGAGGTVRTGTIVRAVERRGSRWAVLVGPTVAPQWLSADAVVLALPPAPTARLLREVAPEAAALLAGIEVASMAVITMAFDAAVLGPLPGSGFLVPAVDGRGIKAATFSSGKWGWLADAAPGLAFVRASIGRAGGAAELQRPDRALAATALADLAVAVGRTLPAPVDVHVQRWGGALPQYAVGHTDRVAAVRAGVARVSRLALAGAAYDGVGIPAVVGTGRAAARSVLADLDMPNSTA